MKTSDLNDLQQYAVFYHITYDQFSRAITLFHYRTVELKAS